MTGRFEVMKSRQMLTSLQVFTVCLQSLTNDTSKNANNSKRTPERVITLKEYLQKEIPQIDLFLHKHHNMLCFHEN